MIDFDAVADGDMLAWALERLRTRLPEMLEQAGGGAVAAAVDPDVVAARWARWSAWPRQSEVHEVTAVDREGLAGHEVRVG